MSSEDTAPPWAPPERLCFPGHWFAGHCEWLGAGGLPSFQATVTYLPWLTAVVPEMPLGHPLGRAAPLTVSGLLFSQYLFRDAGREMAFIPSPLPGGVRPSHSGRGGRTFLSKHHTGGPRNRSRRPPHRPAPEGFRGLRMRTRRPPHGLSRRLPPAGRGGLGLADSSTTDGRSLLSSFHVILSETGRGGGLRSLSARTTTQASPVGKRPGRRRLDGGVAAGRSVGTAPPTAACLGWRQQPLRPERERTAGGRAPRKLERRRGLLGPAPFGVLGHGGPRLSDQPAGLSVPLPAGPGGPAVRRC